MRKVFGLMPRTVHEGRNTRNVVKRRVTGRAAYYNEANMIDAQMACGKVAYSLRVDDISVQDFDRMEGNKPGCRSDMVPSVLDVGQQIDVAESNEAVEVTVSVVSQTRGPCLLEGEVLSAKQATSQAGAEALVGHAGLRSDADLRSNPFCLYL